MKLWRMVAAVLAIATWLQAAQASNSSTFMSEVGRVSSVYERLANSAESERLIGEGKKSEVNARLKALVPEASKSAYDAFVLSNILYRADITASDAYMKLADEKLPGNSFVMFERGMREHRAGRCDVALPLYEKAATLLPRSQAPDRLWAYITHCRLVLGDARGAVAAWNHVDFREKHTAIEKSMYDIFSTTDPDAERERLIRSIHAGAAGDVCTLTKLDKNWEIDWWNAKRQPEYLAHDIALVRSLSRNDKNFQQVVGLCIDAVDLDDNEFRRFIASAGYWGEGGRLPEDPIASYTLISQLQKRKMATADEIFQRYGVALEQRYKRMPADRSTLDLLAFLYSATGRSEQLKPIDLYGWKTLKIEAYALSYLKGLAETDTGYSAALAQAARDFPNSAEIQRLNLVLHAESDDKVTYLMRYVAAQFPNVQEHLSGRYRLDDFMAALKNELDVSVPKK
ncbi:hypothetical protein [Xanthomonas floridensis]|uniref:DUF4034 domain-containing protein n=2 Tax=Xanthomonas floridensis TaxID=1843580 RepID=A0ABU5Q3R2_9XANT|nr:hypothetical protein [Xanthomonas floridensis]MEA5126515.1 hypothetical protein [Xanthomonas floridensis]MEA5133401.1 hypothetical protein [Xanthomonas floridensis]